MRGSSEPVRWGVLGTADIALRKVIPAIAGSALSHVLAIASRSPERAADTAGRLAIPRGYGSYEAMLADPDIEAVYIPLPNHLHLQWTLAAAAAGKHVLCEKPLALGSADARSMIDGCAEAGVKLMEAFMYRLHPMWVQVREMVESGAIGDLRSVMTVFSYYNDDPSDIRNIAEFGGGALYDIGCYAVNVARMLFAGEPTRVQSLLRRDDGFGTDILASAMLDFDGGHAAFTCSTQMEPHQRVDIIGTDGRLVVEIPFNIPPNVATRILRYHGGEPPVSPVIEVTTIPAADQYRIQADAFSLAIRERTPVPNPPLDALANLSVIERILGG